MKPKFKSGDIVRVLSGTPSIFLVEGTIHRIEAVYCDELEGVERIWYKLSGSHISIAERFLTPAQLEDLFR